jgi:hypothetical protein
VNLQKLMVGLTVTTLATLTWSGAANASIVDVSNPPGTSSCLCTIGLNDYLEIQQQVTDVHGGILAGITLYTLEGDDVDTVNIGVGNAFHSGNTYAFSQTNLDVKSTGTFIDTSAAHIVLTPGENFFIDVSGNPNTTGTVTGNLATNGPYLDGKNLYLVVDATPYLQEGESMAFITYIATPVPVPAAVWLLMSGLGMLTVGFRRRGAALA